MRRLVVEVRLLQRNKKDIWFSNPTGCSYATDANGFKTGEKVITYSVPVKTQMSISISSGANNLGSQGMADIQPYGLTTGYTHRAATEDMNCAMGEESHVWYGITPTVLVNGVETVPHNFVVVRKAVSLNHLIYYLKEVDVQYPAVTPTPTPTPPEPDNPDDPEVPDVPEVPEDEPGVDEP